MSRQTQQNNTIFTSEVLMLMRNQFSMLQTLMGEGEYGTNVAPADQDLESLLLRDVIPNGSTISTKNQRYGLEG